MKLMTLQPLDGKLYYVFQFKGSTEADQIIDTLKNCSGSVGIFGNSLDNNELINVLNKRRKPGATLGIGAPVISVLREDEMEKLMTMLDVVLNRACGIIREAKLNAVALQKICSDFTPVDGKTE